MDMSIHDIDRAVQLAMTPVPHGSRTAEAVREQTGAEALVNHLVTTKGVEFYVECAMNSSSLHTGFFCCQQIESFIRAKYDRVSGPRSEIRERVTSLLAKFADPSLQSFIKNKLALCVCLFIKFDYPERWPEGFDHLMQLGAESGGGLDILLRVLRAMDDEIIGFNVDRSADEVAHNTLIKTTMHSSGAVSQLVQFLLSTVSRQVTDGPDMTDFDKKLGSKALNVVSSMLGWIDVEIAAAPDVLEIVFQALHTPHLQVSAVHCLQELVHKGMPLADKLQFFAESGILSRLVGSAPLLPELLRGELRVSAEETDESTQDYLMEIAELVVTIGSDCFVSVADTPLAASVSGLEADRLRSLYSDTVMQLIQLTLRIVALPLDAVCHQAVDSLQQITECMKIQAKQSDGDAGPSVGFDFLGGAMDVLQTAMQRSAVRMDVSFDPDDEEYAMFCTVRGELKTVMVNVCRLMPLQTLRTMLEAFEGVLTTPASADVSQLELVVYCLYCYGDGFARVQSAMMKGVKALLERGPDQANTAALLQWLQGVQPPTEGTECAQLLLQAVAALHQSGAFQRDSHPQLLTAYFDLAERFYPVLLVDKAMLSAVFTVLTGDTGVYHSDASVRVRAAYKLNRIVIAAARYSSVFSSFLDPLLTAVSQLLEVPYPPVLQAAVRPGQGEPSSLLSAAEQHPLFELIGTVLGQTWIAADARCRMLLSVLQPLLQQLEAGVDALESGAISGLDADEADTVYGWTGHMLGAAAHLTKGLKRPEEPLQPAFEALTAATIRCFRILNASDDVRKPVYFMLHRMIQCMGTGLLGLMDDIMPTLMSVDIPRNTAEVLRLVNNLMGIQGEAATMFVSRSLLPILQHVSEVMPRDPAPQSDAANDAHTLQKSMLMLFDKISTTPCNVLFLRPPVVAELPVLVDAVTGLMQQGDPAMAKMAVQVCTAWLEQWFPDEADGGSPVPEETLRALVPWLTDSGLRAAVQLLVMPNWSSIDRSTTYRSLLVCLIVWARRAQAAGLDVDIPQLLATSLLPAIGVPPDMAAEYARLFGSAYPAFSMKRSKYIHILNTTEDGQALRSATEQISAAALERRAAQ